MRELLSRMDAQEYLRWCVHDIYDPIGQARGDMQAGLIASVLANQWKDEKDEPISATDMMPDFGGLRAKKEAKERAQKKIEKWQRFGQAVQELSREVAERRVRVRDEEDED